jgi:hypothetical protein
MDRPEPVLAYVRLAGISPAPLGAAVRLPYTFDK